MMTSLLGPGMVKSVKLTGIDQMTVDDLRRLMAQLPANLPADASVDLHTEAPDRPGERNAWSIAVRWRDEEPGP